MNRNSEGNGSAEVGIVGRSSMIQSLMNQSSIHKGGNKTMNTLSKKLSGIIAVGLLALGLFNLKADRLWADGATSISSSAVVDVLVTPVVTVSLTANPTYYNFGTLELNSSSISAAAVTITNAGNVGVTMQKHNNNPSGWTIGTSTGADIFSLYTATADARPTLGALETAANRLSTSLSNLQGNGGATQVSMNANQAVNVWFEIHMPTTTTSALQKTIPVHFVGTSQ